MKSNFKKGITLVEMMVTTMLFMIIMGGLYTAMIAGNRSWANFDNNITLQREARGALMAMVKELREATNIAITQPSGSSSINFDRSGVGNITFSWTNSGGNANQVIRSDGTNTRILAQNISTLSFTDLSSAIQIDITANKPQTTGTVNSFSMKEKVALR